MLRPVGQLALAAAVELLLALPAALHRHPLRRILLLAAHDADFSLKGVRDCAKLRTQNGIRYQLPRTRGSGGCRQASVRAPSSAWPLRECDPSPYPGTPGPAHRKTPSPEVCGEQTMARSVQKGKGNNKIKNKKTNSVRLPHLHPARKRTCERTFINCTFLRTSLLEWCRLRAQETRIPVTIPSEEVVLVRKHKT